MKKLAIAFFVLAMFSLPIAARAGLQCFQTKLGGWEYVNSLQEANGYYKITQSSGVSEFKVYTDEFHQDGAVWKWNGNYYQRFLSEVRAQKGREKQISEGVNISDFKIYKKDLTLSGYLAIWKTDTGYYFKWTGEDKSAVRFTQYGAISEFKFYINALNQFYGVWKWDSSYYKRYLYEVDPGDSAPKKEPTKISSGNVNGTLAKTPTLSSIKLVPYPTTTSPVKNPTPAPKKTLTGVTVTSLLGDSVVKEGSNAFFEAKATFSDKSMSVVTNVATWSENSSHAQISSGKLTTSKGSLGETIIVTAAYTSGGVTKKGTKKITVINKNAMTFTRSKSMIAGSVNLEYSETLNNITSNDLYYYFFQWGNGNKLQIYADCSLANVNCVPLVTITYGLLGDRLFDTTYTNVSLPFTIDPVADGWCVENGDWFVAQVVVSSPVNLKAQVIF